MKNSLFVLFVIFSASSCMKKEEPLLEQLSTLEIVLPQSGNQSVSRIIKVENHVIIVGTNDNGIEKNIFLLKTDLDGNIIFQKNIAGLSNAEGNGVILNSENDLILAASVTDNSGNKNMALIKTDLSGNFIWQKTFGGTENEAGRAVVELSGGGYMLMGTTSSFGAGVADMYVVKTDSEGNEIWSRTFGGAELDGGIDLVQVNPNKIMLLGFTHSFGVGDRDIYVQSVSANGDSLWSSTYGGAGYEETHAIQTTSDGGYIICGHSASEDPSHSLHALRISANGSIVFENQIGTSTEHEGGEAALAATNGDLVFAGYSSTSENAEQLYYVKTDASGDLLTTNLFGGTGDQRGTDLIETELSYFIIGTSLENNDKDILLVKVPKSSN